ncbi:efflux RND transporter permease subunit, partial [Sphingobium yanoikuyae]
MLKSLAAWALSYRLIVIALALLTAVLGAWAFVNLPVDAYPNIAQTQVKVILKAPGMTPEEVESRVITPIEMEMLGIPGQAILRSSAKYAIADITIDFVDGTDIYWARQQVAERLSGVMGDLPPAVSGGMAPISTPLSDIFMFTIEGPLSLEEKRTLLDWTIRPALRTVPGVADVNALGGFVRTFEVRPDPIALASAGLGIADLQEAIERGNRNDGAGRLAQGEESLIVRAVGAIRSEADLQSMVIATRNGRIVRMGDVATVGTGSLTRYGAVTANGKGEAVQGLVIALRGADARAVVDSVKARVAELEKTLPQGTTIAVFYDRSDLIGRAVGTVEKALIEATILVIILLILFLGDWRAAAIVAATLPMSALVTFLMMRGMGLSANLMSLGGLAIAIGMLVDGAVVVVENIVERLNHAKDDGPPRLHNVYRATGEVVVPVSAGIVIIALVFLPLLSLEGLEGKLFAPVALTIIFALAGSLLIALTLVPVLASLGLKAGHHGEPWIMRKLTPRYRALLDGAFGRKRLVYGLAALGLVLAGLAYGAVGKTFMPSMDEGSVIVQTAKLPTINLDQSVLGDTAVQRSLMKDVPEIAQIIARVGTDEIGLDPMSPNETDSFVVLKPQQEWRGDKAFVVDEIRKSLDKLPGIEPTFTQPIEMRVSEMLTGSRGDLAVKIFGPDLATL